MKTIKMMLASALIGLGIVSQVSAAGLPTATVYLTGSTAFRGNVYNSLVTAGSVFDAVPTVVSYGNSVQSKGIYMLFRGTINTVDTAVNCFWTGSEAGIAALTPVTAAVAATLNDGTTLAGVPATFLSADSGVNPGGAPGNATFTIATPPPSGNLEAGPMQPDLAFADTSKAVSLTKGSGILDQGIVGIVPFTWAKGVNSGAPTTWSHVVNITDSQAFFLLGAGTLADFLTGDPINDGGTVVYPVGRNKGSGTRVNTLIDTGYGVAKGVDQVAVNSTVGNNPVSGLFGLYFDSTIVGYQLTDVADNGYESGGDVANALKKDSVGQTDPNTGLPFVLVGYLGTSDANGIGSGTDHWLTLNGVFESDGAVEEGTYSFWGHEHLYGRSTGARVAQVTQVVSGSPKPTTGLVGALNTLLLNNGALNNTVNPNILHSSGIRNSYMNTDKGVGSDTGLPSPPSA
jgi:hypothetical protein